MIYRFATKTKEPLMPFSLRRLLFSFVLAPLLIGCGDVARNDSSSTAGSRKPIEDQPETAQAVLAGAPDRAACATALQQLNSYIANHEDKRPPALTAEQKDLLTS